MDVSQAQQLLQQIRDNYLAELPARCDEIENLILSLKREHGENYNELYRQVHSMKGSAGTHGLMLVSSICHELEDHLTGLDQPNGNADDGRIDILLQLLDLIRRAGDMATTNSGDVATLEDQLEKIRKQTLQDLYPVLLVETAGYVRQICQEALRDLPVALTVENDGLLALQRLLTTRFACVITAIETGPLNGIAMISAIRHSETQNKKINTILLASRKKTDEVNDLAIGYVIKRDAALAENLKRAVSEIFQRKSELSGRNFE